MTHAPLQHVRTGLDLLLQERLRLVQGRKVGLLANPTSVTRDLTHAAAALLAKGIDLRCLFGPEHGVGGEAQDMEGVDSTAHCFHGVPVFSLYGNTLESLRPTLESLAQVDVLVVDLQDVGSRYYTYVWTALLAAEACASAGKDLLVLDRPNPIGAVAVEGPGIDAGFESFVGLHSLSVRHGMTLAEILRLAVAERRLDLSWQVVSMEGYQRQLLFDQLDLPWVLPSPNMPTLQSALVYPGGCLLEATNVSEGRGTTRPFELVGAPWVDGQRWADALRQEDLPGVIFRPLTFKPSFQKHAGTICGGIQLHVVDRHRFRPFATGVALVLHLQRLWPEHFSWREAPYEFVTDRPAVDLLTGGPWLRRGMAQGASLQDLVTGWALSQREFCERRQPFLLYEAN